MSTRTLTRRRTTMAAAGVLAVLLAVVGGYLWSRSYADPAPQTVALDLSDPAALAAHTYLIGCGRQPVTRPSEVRLTCADANTALTNVHWTSWGGPEAAATATYVENGCTPSCAAGASDRYPARLSVGHVVRKDGTCRYRRIVVTFPGSRPAWVKHDTATFDVAQG